MSGLINMRRSVNGQNDQLGRKYLSDELTGYYVYWASGGAEPLTISYSSLPIGDAIAKLQYSSLALGYHNLDMYFRTPQCLSAGYVVEWYWRSTGQPPSNVYFYIHGGPTTGRSVSYSPTAPGANWSKVSLPLNIFLMNNPLVASKSLVLSRVYRMTFTGYHVALAFDYEFSGFTIRRL